VYQKEEKRERIETTSMRELHAEWSLSFFVCFYQNLFVYHLMIVHYVIVHHCSSLQFIIICSFPDWMRFLLLHTLVYIICCWFLFSYISCNNFFNILIKIKKITIKENKQVPTNKIESRRTAAHKRQQYNSTHDQINHLLSI